MKFKSYGAIVFRKNIDNIEVLLCKRRNTYAFQDFITGRYHYNSLPQLFNNMTAEEKFYILNDDFDSMTFKLYLAKCSNNNYKSRYEQTKKEINIKSLIQKSTNSDSVWELPKGKNEPNEEELNAALRELKEETGLNLTDFQIISDSMEKYVIEDNHNIYESHFIICKCVNDHYLQNYENSSPIEINCSKWWNIESVYQVSIYNDIIIDSYKKFYEYIK